MIQRRVNGRPVRVTLGRFPPMTVESARRLAHERTQGLHCMRAA